MDVLHTVQRPARYVRYVFRAAVGEAAALAHTVSRVREPGPEREQLIQSGKSAGAALLAWVVAAYLLHSPVALMAPWVALVLVQATVYRSVLKGIQQLVAIAVGAVLALSVQLAVGNPLVALAISLPVMLLLGQWRHFGAEGIYAATTALFVLAYGPLSWGGVLDRLAEAGLGAVIGIAVNALVHPPVLLRRSRTWVRSLGADVHELLSDMSTGMAGEFGYEDARGWHGRVDRLDRSLEDLRSTLSHSRESLTLNPSRWRHEPTQQERDYDVVASIFERVVDHVADVTRTLVDDGELTEALVTDAAAERLPTSLRLSYAVFLREVAAGMLAYAERVTGALGTDDTTARLDEKVRCARGAFARYGEATRSVSSREGLHALGALSHAGHRLLVDLDEMRSSAAGEAVTR